MTTTPHGPDTLAEMTLTELWDLYEQLLGERSKAPNRKFLIGKIVAAQEEMAAQVHKEAPATPATEPWVPWYDASAIPVGCDLVAMSSPQHRVDFRRLFEGARSALLVMDPDLKVVAVSNAYLAATMTQRAEIVGRYLFEIFPDNPDDPAASGVRNLGASLARVIQHRRMDAMAVQKYDIRRPASEGGGFEVRYWSPVNVPVMGDAGQLLYIVHEVTDVTEFVELRARQDETAQRNRALLERTAGMEAEVIARGIELQQANAELRRARDELERRVEERTAELRTTEEQLRHAQRMESVGRLAGGIAHDFNNILSVIMSFTELVREELPPQDPKSEDLSQVLIASERAAGLTRQLLAFSRQQVVQTSVFEIDPVVASIERMLVRLLGEDVDLTTRLGAPGAKVFADPGQVEQVITNLAVNARDAMPTGGKLSIETGLVELSAEYAREHVGAQSGPHVMLAVSDTGHGMTKEIQSRIFDPFFTTKEVGRGTGLGLSTVFGIVKQAGGNIWVYSELGIGTTFKVYFPLAEGMVTDPIGVGVNAGDLSGTETILLVEDDELVRAAAMGILRGKGYRVSAHGSSEGALAFLAGFGGAVDLLLTDVVMRGMNGREMAAEVMRLRPGVAVLYMSGYTDDAIVRHGVLTADIHFLQKPFTPEAMARRVREVLDLKIRQRE